MRCGCRAYTWTAGWPRFDYSLLYGGRLWLLKTGFDETQRRLAPGLVMRLGIIERCIELGLEAHELLGADEPWEAEVLQHRASPVQAPRLSIWTTGSIPYGYRRHVRPRLRTAYRTLRRASRRPG